MKRIDKNGKKRKLNIEFIYKNDGTKLEEIMRLIDRIEIDKDKKIYVHLKFPELIIND